MPEKQSRPGSTSPRGEPHSTQRRDPRPTPAGETATVIAQASRQLLRLPVLVAALAGLATTAVAAVLAGGPGALGGALATVVTVVFFALTLLLLRWTARLAPEMVMAVALAAYGFKVGALLTLLIVLYEATWLNGNAFAAGIIVCTLVWLPAQVWAFRRARLSVYG